MFRRTSVHKIIFLLCWLICETYSYVGAFRCDNGKTIRDDYFCNRYQPESYCGDGSDKGFGCDRHSCSAGRFTCLQSHKCLPISHRCDGVHDCSDASDEDNCVFSSDGKSYLENCTPSNGKFWCRDDKRCLNFNRACNGVCDCEDCSDENSANCKKYDDDSCRSCPDHCLPTPEGPQCVCNSSNSELNAACRSKFQDCALSDMCDQNCIRYDSKITKCWCSENFLPVPGTNNSECRTPVWYEDVLLYTTVSKIKSLNVTSDQAQVIKSVGLSCTALSAARNYTYYADFGNANNRSTIFKIENTSGETREIIETDALITSLAVDWITENIYFTNNKSVSVCTNNGDICIQLDCCDINYVALAPAFGWMYYTAKSKFTLETSIIKSNMDGSEKNIFVDESFPRIVSLAIDESRDTLYWLIRGASFEIEELHSVSLHGSNGRIRSLPYGGPFSSFTVLDKTVFLLKHHTTHSNVIYSNLKLSKIREYKDSTTNFITNVYAYNPALRNASKIANPCAATSCSGLCLLRPSSQSNRLNFTCTCQNRTSKKNETQWCNRLSTQRIGEVGWIPETEPEITLVTEQFMFTDKETDKMARVEIKKTQNSSTSSATYEPKDHLAKSVLTTTVTPTTTISVKKSLGYSSSPNVSIPASAVRPREKSHTDGVLLGFLMGITFISVILVLYFIFRKVYWNRNHQQMSVSVSELMNL